MSQPNATHGLCLDPNLNKPCTATGQPGEKWGHGSIKYLFARYRGMILAFVRCDNGTRVALKRKRLEIHAEDE